MGIACSPAFHRHQQTCARCGTTEGNIASTVTRDGATWPPMCVGCMARVIRQSTKEQRIAALAKVEGLA